MQTSPRLVALDHLRGFVVVLVVLHHAVLAYCHFGHTDRYHYVLSTAPVVDAQRWIGFDALVMLNDGFFMPLLFLLSGLFVWRGLQNRGAWAYFGKRALRLGLPFVTAVLTVVPLAYYPSWLQAGGVPGFARFWVEMVTTGPWPSGPPWFLGVLLGFDAIAALAFAALRLRPPSVSVRALPASPRPFGLLLLGLALAYLPLLFMFGPSRWISLGPLAVQASRIGLYGASFAAGVVLGATRLDGDAAALVRRWPTWALLTIVAGAVMVGTQAARLRYGPTLVGWAWLGAYGLTLTVFCATACIAMPAVFLRFAGRPSRLWDSLVASSFGIYLLHYPVVTWVQFGLLHVPVGAFGKAGVTFAAALLLSWALAALPWHAVGAVPRAAVLQQRRGP
ncbi:MAG: acyltransferase family protein [Janthinobacterium lividum]